jgi:hypothetical protein
MNLREKIDYDILHNFYFAVFFSSKKKKNFMASEAINLQIKEPQSFTFYRVIEFCPSTDFILEYFPNANPLQ